MATQAERIAALESNVGSIAEGMAELLAAMQASHATEETPKRGPGRPKGSGSGKQTPKGVGRTSTFKLATLTALGITATVGGTFVYPGKRGKSTWHVLAITSGVVTAERVA